jgi:hypothetical protein
VLVCAGVCVCVCVCACMCMSVSACIYTEMVVYVDLTSN